MRKVFYREIDRGEDEREPLNELWLHEGLIREDSGEVVRLIYETVLGRWGMENEK